MVAQRWTGDQRKLIAVLDRLPRSEVTFDGAFASLCIVTASIRALYSPQITNTANGLCFGMVTARIRLGVPEMRHNGERLRIDATRWP